MTHRFVNNAVYKFYISLVGVSWSGISFNVSCDGRFPKCRVNKKSSAAATKSEDFCLLIRAINQKEFFAICVIIILVGTAAAAAQSIIIISHVLKN